MKCWTHSPGPNRNADEGSTFSHPGITLYLFIFIYFSLIFCSFILYHIILLFLCFCFVLYLFFSD